MLTAGENLEDPRIIVVYWPTASGKTALSLDLAERFSGEIISADSRQIFRGMDVGTGKIRPEETRGIPHHCLDIAEPDQDFSVALFVEAAEAAIRDILKRGRRPVLCGGTGLYLDALLFEFDVPEVAPDPKLRQELETLRAEFGNEALWKRLRDIDPEYASELHPNNFHYVIRGIEVKKKTGKSKTEFRTERRLKYPDARFVTAYDGNRESLYERINDRVDAMFAQGLEDETRKLLEKYGRNAFGLKTIGYAETAAYLAGETDFPACVELIKKNTRHYAKRQITWNKRYPNNFLTGAEFGL